MRFRTSTYGQLHLVNDTVYADAVSVMNSECHFANGVSGNNRVTERSMSSACDGCNHRQHLWCDQI